MDYGYNMVINIAFGKLFYKSSSTLSLIIMQTGAVNIIGWLLWCLRNKKRLPHARKCAQFVVLVAATTVFEVWDFPPLFWVLDAHALWHLATSPLALIWYR